jgi:hypothetical protein
VSRRRRSATTVAGVLLAAACAAGCATEVDPDIQAEVTVDSPATTEFVPAGSTAELLGQLLVAASVLSEAIVANDGQHELMDRIDVLWGAARPGVEEAQTDALRELDRAIVMLHTGVDRRRPADADKAYNNLVQLVAAVAAAVDSEASGRTELS